MIKDIKETRTTIEKEAIIQQFERLNNLVENHWTKYKERPSIIIMSQEFSYSLGYLMSERVYERDRFGNKIETLFGIPCICSPRLNNLEFEVY